MELTSYRFASLSRIVAFQSLDSSYEYLAAKLSYLYLCIGMSDQGSWWLVSLYHQPASIFMDSHEANYVSPAVRRSFCKKETIRRGNLMTTAKLGTLRIAAKQTSEITTLLITRCKKSLNLEIIQVVH